MAPAVQTASAPWTALREQAPCQSGRSAPAARPEERPLLCAASKNRGWNPSGRQSAGGPCRRFRKRGFRLAAYRLFCIWNNFVHSITNFCCFTAGIPHVPKAAHIPFSEHCVKPRQQPAGRRVPGKTIRRQACSAPRQPGWKLRPARPHGFGAVAAFSGKGATTGNYAWERCLRPAATLLRHKRCITFIIPLLSINEGIYAERV